MKIYGDLDLFGANVAGHVSNMKLSYSSGRLKIVGYNGSDLSTDNPAHVTINHGSVAKNLAFTSSPLFDDDTAATSDFSGVNIYFHTTTTVAWVNDLPFFIYATYDTLDNPLVFISPCPNHSVVPASAYISYHNTAGATQDKYACFFLTSALTPANVAGQPCIRIGGITMTKVVTTDDWTVVTYQTNGAGIGGDLSNRRFDYVTGHHGATSGGFLRPNGGTAPSFSTQLYKYKVHNNGIVTVQVFLEVNGGVNGAGAVSVQVTIPYSFEGNGDAPNYSSAYFAITTTTYLGVFAPSPTNNFGVLVYQPTATTIASLLNSDFVAGGRTIRFEVQYVAF